MQNVKFTYLYRDAGNYKKRGEVIFRDAEELSLEQITDALREAFLQDGLFIAHQIRVPEVFFYVRGDATSDDHCYHEFDSVEASDDTPCDQHSRSIAQFLVEVQRQATSGWIAFDPHESIRVSV